jgi:hypothetical protein
MKNKEAVSLLWIVMLALLHTISLAGPTSIGGNLSGTLYLTNSPYLVTNNIVIASNQTLTIQAGCVLQFITNTTLAQIEGTLIARGTSGSPISFTSNKSVKTNGQWAMIYFTQTGGTNSIMENCIVESGGASATAPGGIYIENELTSGVLITNCTVRGSASHGIRIFSSDPRIQSCVLSNNQAFAVSMTADSLPVVRNNQAQANGQNAIEINGNNGIITRSGTWVRDNLPYSATDDVNSYDVNLGVTLTLEPGVTLQFTNSDIYFGIDGTLIARGTTNNPILFTSDKAVKTNGQWLMLYFSYSGGTNSILENCIVECAGSSPTYPGNINIVSEADSGVVITNCIIRRSGAHGIRVLGSDARIQNCVFSNNQAFAVSMTVDSFPVLRNNQAQANGQNAIEINGNSMTRGGVWTRDSLLYIVTASVDVSPGMTLTLEPGVTLQFTNVDMSFQVDGTLVARGTSGSPILFTSDKAVKASGQWQMIYFTGTGGTNSIMENCIVECAGSSAVYPANIFIDSEFASGVLITNCTVRKSAQHGVRVYSSDARIQSCVFSNNQGFAVSMTVDSFPVLRNNQAQANGQNAIEIHSFKVLRNGAWTHDSLPYIVTALLDVNSGATLALEPGVTLQFTNADIGFEIYGSLVARGTNGIPILFTSDKLVKTNGQWAGIYFAVTGPGISIMENCIVESGGASTNYPANIYLQNYPAYALLITNCTIRTSLNDGIHCYSSFAPITNSRLLNNGRDGLRTEHGSSPLVTNNIIQGNTSFGINNLDTNQIIVAEGNYWGDRRGPYDNSNTDGLHLVNTNTLGDRVSDYVDWSRFLTFDPTTTPVITITRGTGQVVLAWPGYASNYSLQYATNLASPIMWFPVTDAPAMSGGQIVLTVPVVGPRKFYRLIH